MSDIPTPGTGSGSGARLVSGTVSFSTEDRALAPFVVATTSGATVEGVALSAGQMAAFWYLSGEWHVMVHGQDTTWRSTAAPDTRIEVTPTGPTFTNDDTNGGGTWTTPSQAGIRYEPASGTATPGQAVTVTASLSDATVYKFSAGATTSWSWTFYDPAAPITDTFAGANGTSLTGRSTTTGGMVWAASGTTPAWLLTGSGWAQSSATSVPGDSTTHTTNQFVAPTNRVDFSFDYQVDATGTQRFDVGFGSTTLTAMLNPTATSRSSRAVPS